MKPEPLKNKQRGVRMGIPHKICFFHESRDIKSAVEWLKREIKEEIYKKVRDEAYKRQISGIDAGGIVGYNNSLIFKKIDEAFFDVMG